MILGITGGFGCGKSAVLNYFASHDWFTMDADAVCRSFYECKHPDLMNCILKNFGSGMFDDNGYVDKKKLAAELFSAPEKMRLITGIIYPLLSEKTCRLINECRNEDKNAAFELPLLYEAGYEKIFDAVLAVWCPDGLRKKRLAGRNFSEEEIKKRDSMQLPADEKMERADFAIINSGSLKNLHLQLDNLINTLKNNF